MYNVCCLCICMDNILLMYNKHEKLTQCKSNPKTQDGRVFYEDLSIFLLGQEGDHYQDHKTVGLSSNNYFFD